jgi:hypothetical protein
VVIISLSSEAIPPNPLTPSHVITRKHIKNKEKWKNEFPKELQYTCANILPITHNFENPLEGANSAASLIQKCFMDTIDRVFPIVSNESTKSNTFLINPKYHDKLKDTYNLLKKANGVSKYIFKNIINNETELDHRAKETIEYINSKIEHKFTIHLADQYTSIYNKLTTLQSHLYEYLRTEIGKIKNKKMRKVVKKKLELFDKFPHKVFSIFNTNKCSSIDLISVVDSNKKVKLLFGQDMINEIEVKWTSIYTPTKPKGNIDIFLKHMPTIKIPYSPPNFSIENIRKIL